MSSRPLYFIILAAGNGTRMKSKTPKVLHEVGHKPMLNHVLDTAKKLSPKDMVVVIGDNMQAIHDHVSPISITIQSPAQGTADAVAKGLSQLTQKHGQAIQEGLILILYADTPLLTTDTLQKMINTFHSEHTKPSVVLLGMMPQNPSEYGRIVVDQQQKVLRIVEYKEASAQERKITLCNAGLMLFDGSYLQSYLDQVDNKNLKGEYYLTDCIEIANKAGQTCALCVCPEEEVLGVNNRIDLTQAEEIFQDRLREKFMKEGVTLINPSSIYFSADTQIGKDTIIGPNVIIGQGVTIGENVQILPFTYIEQSTIGDKSQIGPFARLRPGTHTGTRVKIGNFVETKNATIKDGSKVNHHSYIGDADLEEMVVVGAGTITCNYDGEKKHRTKIGNNTFIGSNTSLVAPIEIGSDAYIAAGSVITKNVESKSLGIGRSQQVNKTDWLSRKKTGDSCKN